MILKNFLLLPVFFLIQITAALAQSEQTFYRTNTTYEAYQLDKVPFAMKKLTPVLNNESITIADKTFYQTTLKDGSVIYLTNDRKGYLLLIEKPEQVGFIVSPNGKDWSCYFRYKKGKNENKVPPDDFSNEEVGFLKQALGKITDPRIQYYYITYSSFASKGNTHFAEDSLPIIFISPDTISVGGNLFSKKSDLVYRSPGHTYLYMPDKETMVFRDLDMSDWASFYQSDIKKANQLISQEYKSEKELAAANQAINKMESNKTRAVLNNYFSSLATKKNDADLSNVIIKYWNGRWPGSPAYKVIFIDDDFHITRNSLGVPLRKTIAAWVMYKKNGKCYTQLHEYGYESAGGGVFVKELSQWQMDYYITAQSSQGTEYLHSGEEFEIDCATK